MMGRKKFKEAFDTLLIKKCLRMVRLPPITSFLLLSRSIVKNREKLLMKQKIRKEMEKNFLNKTTLIYRQEVWLE